VKKRAHGGTAKSKRPEGGGRTKDSGSGEPAAPPRFVFIHRRVGQARVGHEARRQVILQAPRDRRMQPRLCSRKRAWVLVPGANPDRGRADTKLLRIHPARGRRSRPLSAMAMLGAASAKPRPSAAPSTCGGVQIWIRRHSATGAVARIASMRACPRPSMHRSDPRQSTRRGAHSRGRARWARAGPENVVMEDDNDGTRPAQPRDRSRKRKLLLSLNASCMMAPATATKEGICERPLPGTGITIAPLSHSGPDDACHPGAEHVQALL
jgi:hypothetical protein